MKLETGPKICIIGAGLAGLCAGLKLKKTENLTNFTIFESNVEVGGTWLVNQYPGSACDVPSHLYSFSFAPKADWSKVYSSQPEIFEYIKTVTQENELYSHIRFQTRVESLYWNPQSLKWTAVIQDIRTSARESLNFDFVISGSGTLRIPAYPDKFKNFTGELLHSAEWKSNVELNGKRVGVVGTGASGIQIVPAIADHVEKLIVFQRRAPYILPKIQFEYPDVCKWTLAKIPLLRWALRAIIFWLLDFLIVGFQYNTIGAKMLKTVSAVQRRFQIPDEGLRQKMTPSYEFGCKRTLPSNEYYPAIQKANVEVISSEIVEVKDKTIVTDDGLRTDLDVLILATGFKAQNWFTPMTVIGKHSKDILHTWKTEGPKTYLGTVCNSLPNFFLLAGPHTFPTHNSLVFVLECQINWVLRLLQEMKMRGVHSFNVKVTAEADFMQFYEAGLSETVWGNEYCGSWYSNSNGKITTLWPFSLTKFWRHLRGLNTDAFNFE